MGRPNSEWWGRRLSRGDSSLWLCRSSVMGAISWELLMDAGDKTVFSVGDSTGTE